MVHYGNNNYTIKYKKGILGKMTIIFAITLLYKTQLTRESKSAVDIGLPKEARHGVIQILNNTLCDEYILPQLEAMIVILLNRILVRSINSSKNNMKRLTKL
jgi:hypothetical protein